jgi:hypothetical protein
LELVQAVFAVRTLTLTLLVVRVAPVERVLVDMAQTPGQTFITAQIRAFRGDLVVVLQHLTTPEVKVRLVAAER